MNVARSSRTDPDIERLEGLAQQHAALQRIATLVAQGAPSGKLFATAAQEIHSVLGVPFVSIARYSPDGEAALLASCGKVARPEMSYVPDRSSLHTTDVSGRIRIDGESFTPGDALGARGETAVNSGSTESRTRVGMPIVVAGRVWGAVIAASPTSETLPAETEARLADFTELLEIGITNGEARAELRHLAEEQAALRRVATLIAEGAEPKTVFTAVAVEAARVLRVDAVSLLSYDAETQMFTKIFGTHGERSAVPDGTQSAVADCPEGALVVRTGRPARVDDWTQIPGLVAARHRQFGYGQAIAAPIVLDGRIWGYTAAYAEVDEVLAPDAETRLADFTNLMATSLANLQARDELRGLAEEQAALRRVATIVANERPAEEVFAVVAEEVGRLVQAESAAVWRFESEQDATVVANVGAMATPFPVGSHAVLDGDSTVARVKQTERAVRFDQYETAVSSIAARSREVGLRSAVGFPIVVNGHLWGAIVAGARRLTAMPADAENRIEPFTGLVATAISNIRARDELAASRARVLASADEERRRVVRDLHDGAQQRLVHTIVTLKMARRELGRFGDDAAALVDEPLEQAESANQELRELAHGIIPSVLTKGLAAAVWSLASRMSIPVEVDISVARLPREVEAAAYFVVAEALTNVAKHAQADHATVQAHIDGGTLHLEVRDDGIGGAAAKGSGLVGLSDRVAAHKGTLRIDSLPEEGTLILASIPVG
jgi:signal transduction histidine kinase